MIELDALIFDFGNVISLPRDPAAVAAMRDLIGARLGAAIDPARFDAAYEAPRGEYDRGSLDGAAYWGLVGAALGFRPGPDEVAALKALDIDAWFRVNPAVRDLIAAARPLVGRLALLSNMSVDSRAALLGRAPFLSGFDDLLASCEHLLIKPEPAIYRLALERLGVEAGRALFVDDLEVNIAAARACGLHGHVFRGAEALAEELGLGAGGGVYRLRA